jgi:penicillin-binding protein 2
MPEFNQPRKRIIQLIIVATFIILLARLFVLQVISTKYVRMAEENAIYRKIIYPSRGIIFDRKRKAILNNSIMYDLIVTPNQVKNIDTSYFCELMDIDTAEFKSRIITAIIKNGRVRPSVFEALLTPEKFARINENIAQFQGFTLEERPVRTYPWNAGAALLGYVAEVDTNFLKRHKEEGYQMGDYAGMTGLERSYEKELMGQRGIKYLLRDNKNRIRGSFEDGALDTAAIAGKNLYTSIDIELQKFGEELMVNKVGSIVAIDPQTGGIIAMISSPTYDPNYLTGPERRKHFSELFKDPRLPLLNRTLGTYYSPGSTFKTFVGIVAMSEGVMNENTTVSCSGAYYGCGRRMGCHAAGTFSLRGAISHSCNSYFAVAYRHILDRDGFITRDSALNLFNQYAYSFGLGNRLGVDLPSEKRGNIPTPKYYQKIFGPKWQSCNIISNSIGQGEVLTTLTQLSNMMAIIANKGWYYTPHVVDSIEGGDENGALAAYRIKHHTLNIPDSVFEAVQDGMQGTMEFGTGAAAKVPGIVICGKTGTVENAYKGEKQKDHAFFGAFAPRDHPKIAIAVMCENAGFGATSSAPIASLLIEKYLNDTIMASRKPMIDRIKNMNLIPARMKKEIAVRDSILRAKAGVKEVRDTLSMDDDLDELNDKKPLQKKPAKDTSTKMNKAAAVLPDQRKKGKQTDSADKRNR